MPSIREQLIQSLIATITPAATAHGAAIHRQAVWSIDRNQSPAICIEVVGDKVVDSTNALVVRQLTITINAMWRAESFAQADAAVCDIHAALMENNNLGGLCQSVQEVGGEWDNEDADGGAVLIPQTYEIRYRTKKNDITKIN